MAQRPRVRSVLSVVRRPWYIKRVALSARTAVQAVVVKETIFKYKGVRELKELKELRGVKDVCLDYDNSQNDGEILLSLTPLNSMNSLNSLKKILCAT